MPDRLEILRHQRALVQQQLGWLDQEIAAAEAAQGLAKAAPSLATSPGAPVSPAAPATLLPSPTTPSPLASVAPDESQLSIASPDPADFESDKVDVQAAARRGCLLYTVIAFALMFAALVIIYFVAYRDHPVLFAPEVRAPSQPSK